jgi:hypothetical protein
MGSRFPVHDFVSHPVNRARLAAGLELVHDGLVLTRWSRHTVATGRRASPHPNELCRVGRLQSERGDLAPLDNEHHRKEAADEPRDIRANEPGHAIARLGSHDDLPISANVSAVTKARANPHETAATERQHAEAEIGEPGVSLAAGKRLTNRAAAAS